MKKPLADSKRTKITDRKPGESRQAAWQRNRVRFGKCRRCGQFRGQSTSPIHCSDCLAIDAAQAAARYAKRKAPAVI